MFIIDSFGKNVIIDGNIVGYLQDNGIFVHRRKLYDLSDDGIISSDGVELGYVDDDGIIVVKGEEVGYIDADNNFVLYRPRTKK